MGPALLQLFPNRFTAAAFHCAGTTHCDQQVLKRFSRTTSSAGHVLKTMYGMPSKGQGAEVDFIFLTAPRISPGVISSHTNSTCGYGEDTIHTKVLCSAWYVSAKKVVASSFENCGIMSVVV